jgi:hypothetical protein
MSTISDTNNSSDTSVVEEDDYLPVGAHLLPQEFRDFIYNCNKTIAGVLGDWVGEARRAFRENYPMMFKLCLVYKKRLYSLYPEEIEAVKAYQKEYAEQNVD